MRPVATPFRQATTSLGDPVREESSVLWEFLWVDGLPWVLILGTPACDYEKCCQPPDSTLLVSV